MRQKLIVDRHDLILLAALAGFIAIALTVAYI
jgi:hypothetical protein